VPLKPFVCSRLAQCIRHQRPYLDRLSAIGIRPRLLTRYTRARARPPAQVAGQRTSRSTKSSSRGHFPVLAADCRRCSCSSPGRQVAAILVAAPPGTPRRQCPRCISGSQRRQVPPADNRARRTCCAWRFHWGRRRATLARAQATAYLGDQVVAEAELCCSASSPTEPPSIRRPLVHARAHIGQGTIIGTACRSSAPDRAHRRELHHRRLVRRRRMDRYRRRDGDFIRSRSIGLNPAGPEVSRRGTRLSIGRRNIFRRIRDHHRGTMGGGGVTEDSAIATSSWRTCMSRNDCQRRA